jgi:hypothetical protein
VRTKAAQAAVGGASSRVRLKDVTGPNTAVTGAMSRAAEGVEVAHAARFHPAGALIACEYSGLIPCATAYGHQRQYQMNRLGSTPCCPTLGTSRPPTSASPNPAMKMAR